jgi:hypothetical protein
MTLTTPFTSGTKFKSRVESGEHVQSVDVDRIRDLIGTREFGACHALRGQRYITTTGYMSFNLNAATAMALAENPAASGKYVFLDLIEFGTVGADSRFSRFGSVTINSRGTAAVVGNTGGFTQVASVTNPQTEAEIAAFKVYPTGQFTATVPGGVTARKVAPMKSYEPYFVESRGTTILRPGANVYWATSEPPGGGSGAYEAYINFEWVELPEADALALISSMQGIDLA